MFGFLRSDQSTLRAQILAQREHNLPHYEV